MPRVSVTTPVSHSSLRRRATLAALASLMLTPTSAAATSTSHQWVATPNGVVDVTVLSQGAPGDGAEPAVIMAPGLGDTFSGEPSRVARSFVERGITVLGIDYATYGNSIGSPRRLVDPIDQQEDLEAVTELALSGSLPGVDGARVALWGTSLGGANALAVAARKPGVRAVVAQTPILNTEILDDGYLRPITRAIDTAVRKDLAAARTGASYELPLLGGTTSVSLIHSIDAARYLRTSVGRKLANRAPARTARALNDAPTLNLDATTLPPAFVVNALMDDIAWPIAVRELAQSAGAELVEVDTDHFGIYASETRAQLTEQETTFLELQLGLSQPF